MKTPDGSNFDPKRNTKTEGSGANAIHHNQEIADRLKAELDEAINKYSLGDNSSWKDIERLMSQIKKLGEDNGRILDKRN